MSLIPYEPFRYADYFRRQLDQLLDNDFPLYTKGLGRLDMDVYETENEVVVTCDIPGLEKKEDVHIEVDNNIFSISGSIQREHEINEDQIYRKERFAGRFQRSIALPAAVSPEGVQATYKNGVLEVRMQKLQNPGKKKIDVQFH
jgi:HSP20 family protein